MSLPAVDRSIGTILQDILENLQEIVRAEVRLAKAEFREQMQRARTAGILMSVAAAMAFFSVLFVLIAIACALALVLPAWGAALSVAIAVAIVAGILIVVAIANFRKLGLMPRSVASLKEDVEWTKRRVR